MLAIQRLLDICIQLSAERNLDKLLSMIIEQTNYLLRADRSSLFLVNHEAQCLESKVAQGIDQAVFKVPMDSGITGWVATHLQLLNIPDAQQDERLFRPDIKGETEAFPVRSMLCVPLLDAEQQLHGVIQVMRLAVLPFNHEDEQLIRAMASQATVAIKNALHTQQLEQVNEDLERKVAERTEALRKKNKELEHIATTDGLTGAFNRRHFDQLFLHKSHLAERYGSVFSIIMFDIDFFKRINDSQGHDTGDLVLQKMSSEVDDLLRECDFLFRYGGEEFVALLPHTGLKGSRILAERLRYHVEKLVFTHGELTLTNVTISLGVAVWYEDDRKQAAQLLKRADQALYHAKEHGRNRVSCAT